MNTKIRLIYMLPTKDPFQIYGHILTENNRMETVHRNGNQKKAGIAILISGKIDFQIKIVTRDKEVYYIKIMGSV